MNLDEKTKEAMKFDIDNLSKEVYKLNELLQTPFPELGNWQDDLQKQMERVHEAYYGESNCDLVLNEAEYLSFYKGYLKMFDDFTKDIDEDFWNEVNEELKSFDDKELFHLLNILDQLKLHAINEKERRINGV